MNKKRCLTAMTLAIIMAVSSVWPVRAEAETFSSEDLDDSYNDDSIDENPEDFRIESSEEIDNLSSESGSDENYSWEYDSETKSLTIIGSGEIENKPWISDWGKEVEHITIKSTGATDAGQLFYGMEKVKDIDLSEFDTSNVTNMEGMFHRCTSLTSLDLSGFDTSKVTNMKWMFYKCLSLTSLDLSSFNTSNVANMSLMFSQCYSLTSLDLSSFDTSKVTHMGWMFDECTSLTSLDLSGFDTSKVTNINNMFDGCSSLTSVDLSSFDTSNVTGMSGMFGGCNSLTSLDLSNFDTGNVIGMVRMFDECTSLTSLDLSGFDTSKVTEMDRMFRDCSSLKAIKTPYITVTETDLPFTMYDSETGTAYDSIPILTGKSLTLVRDMSIDPTLLFVERIITLNKSTLELEKGKTEILTARITPSDVTENTIMWDSSDRLVATVDSNGTVTAVAAGNAVITASTISGTISAECHVKVTDPNAADDPGDNPSEGENDHGDVLPGDVPSDGIIPEGIWVAGIEDVSYAGIPLEQNFCVYDGTTMLVEKTDYSVSYKNNKNVYQMADRNNPSAADKTKAPQVTIKMKGNYSGSQTLYFSILPQSASEASESSLAKVDMSKVKVAKIPGQTYTGSGITVTDLKDASGAAYALGITYQNKPLTLDEDYCVASIAHSTGVGTATVILKGMQASASDTGCSFTGERKVTFRITAKPITAESITINDGKDVSAAYAKGGATPSIVVRDGSQKLKAGKDYTLKFSNNDKVASAKDSKAPTVTIIGKGNYAGKRPVAYDITGRVFGEEMTILASDVTESSKAGRFSAKIQAFDGNGMLLKAGTDYEKTVRYYYDAAGTKEVLKTDTPTAGTVLYAAVTGKGAYSSDTVYAPYTILSKDHDISKAKFSIKPQTYTGSQVLITSQDQFDKAILGTDTLSLNAENGFEVVPGTYQNNVKKGTAKVTLHGTGTYGGYKTVTFKIGTRSILDWWKGLFS